MTQQTVIKRKKEANSPLSILICLSITVLMLVFGKEVAESILSGISLAALRIIPTIFPFIVISDYWASVAEIKNDGFAARVFQKIFKINGFALIAFLMGILCGFPLGVKNAVGLYKSGAISKDELQRLCPIINLPSIAFVVSGVGLGLYGNASVGIILYISVISASVISGLLLSFKSSESKNTAIISRQKFDLVSSIKDAGLSSLAIASYIIFFSGVIGLTSALIKSKALVTIFSTFFEVGNSTNLIIKSHLFPPVISLSLIAFSLGFSGLSVHLQAFSFLPKEISKKRYILTKLLIGLLSASIAFCFSILTV